MSDEDTWIVPTRWLAKAEPIRGITPHRPVPMTADAAAALDKMPDRFRVGIEGILLNAHHEGHSGLADAGLAYLRSGEPSVSSAAAVAAIIRDDYTACCSSLARHSEHFRNELAALLIDGWVVQHGIRFAVDGHGAPGPARARATIPPAGPMTFCGAGGG
ncbi:hypothetical protein [Nocardia sp. NPDC047654]|uniref:hypothetical protein n=1 Tax=Nocardia sp. NPDC047654 TaxID=3364314 RepID=UPI0037163A6E